MKPVGAKSKSSNLVLHGETGLIRILNPQQQDEQEINLHET